MAAEILILSGARQGERMVLDLEQFRAGGQPGCEVWFDPQRDPGARDRAAVFRLMDDGWYVGPSGGELLVNQRPVNEPTHIRSGDVLRLSERGPDFSFHIVRRGAAVSATPAAAKTAPAVPAPNVAPVAPMPTAPAPQAVVAPVSARQTAVVPAPPPAASKTPGSWAVWLGGSIVVAAALLVVGRSLMSPPPQPTPTQSAPQPINVYVTPPAPPAGPTTNSTPSAVPAAAPTNAQPPAAPRDTPPAPAPKEKEPQKLRPTEDPFQAAAARLGDAVFLVQVERSGQFWPFATCCAVGENTLLTTAREATQLATWRRQQTEKGGQGGFRAWVTNQQLGFKEEVDDIRVHGVYATLADKPGEWVYFDLALLTVTEKLPNTVPLAAAEDLVKLKDGLPLACLGYTHDGNKVTEFTKLKPELSAGAIFVITGSQKLSGHPRVLHLRAKVSPNACGSPVLNAAGKLVALYGDAAVVPTGEVDQATAVALKDLHYAPVVSAELIDTWLKDHNEKLWVPPPVTEAPAKPTSQR
jgi:hypothetical protein